jgi:hypothetical protein
MYHIKGSTIILIAGASVFFMINKNTVFFVRRISDENERYVFPRKPLGIKYLVIIKHLLLKIIICNSLSILPKTRVQVFLSNELKQNVSSPFL